MDAGRIGRGGRNRWFRRYAWCAGNGQGTAHHGGDGSGGGSGQSGLRLSIWDNGSQTP